MFRRSVLLIAALFPLLAAPRASALPATPAVRWRELGPPSRADHVMVWDSRRDRALMFGGNLQDGAPFDGAWQLVATPVPHWEPLPIEDEGPLPRSGWSAVYDSLLDRVLLFGGIRTWNDFGSSELWELRLSGTPTWSLLQPEGTLPPGRWAATLILDAADRLVLFGGFGWARADSDVWVLPLRETPLAWQRVTLAGPGPGPRGRHGAAYSALTHRMLVFGGERLLHSNVIFADDSLNRAVTWELSLNGPIHWEQGASAPADTVPLPEAGGPMVADAAGRFAWLIPGWQGYDAKDESTWRYDFTGSAWTRAPTAGAAPENRVAAAACLDRSSGSVLMHGGGYSLSSGTAFFASVQTWRLTPAGIPAWNPAVREPTLGDRTTFDPRAHFDAATRNLIVWTREGVWKRDVAGGGAWSLDLASEGSAPKAREAMSVLDPVRRQLLVFGGLDAESRGLPADSLWAWPLDGLPGWNRFLIHSFTTTGSPPDRIWGTQCAYDTKRQCVYVLPSMTRGRWPVFAIDTVAVLALGEPDSFIHHPEALPSWTEFPTHGTAPSGRTYGTMLFDTTHDRLLLLGGFVPGLDGWLARDLWTLSPQPDWRWTRRIEPALSPVITTQMGFVVDPTLDRYFVIAGAGMGYFNFGPTNLLATAAFDDPAELTTLDPDGASPMRGAGTAFFDAAGDRILWWDGATLWELTWPLATPRPFGPPRVVADTAGVHVSWPGSPVSPFVATIERSIDGGRTWTRFASVVPQSDGSVAFTDRDTPPGGTLAYRAVTERGGSLRVLGTASLALARTPPTSFALAPPRPNPAREAVVIELASPVDVDVTLELFDVSGRRAAPTSRRRIAAGSVAFTFPLPRDLAPGVYLLRASDGRTKHESRLAVFR